MLMALSVAPLNSLGHDDQNEVQHDHLGHVMPLTPTLASSNADGVINDIIAFIRSKWGIPWHFWSCYATGIGISTTWYQWHHQWHHYTPYIKTIEIRCNMTFFLCVTSLALVSASYDVDGVINGTIAFLKSKQLKWGTTFWSCDTFGTDTGSMWCQMQSMTPLHSLGQDDHNEGQYYVFDHLMPLASASNNANSITSGAILFLTSRQLK